jgi:SPP1 family predicted phage head-tail adaptor
MSFVGLLNTTCTVQAKTQTQGSSGEEVDVWADTKTDVKCRLDQASGNEILTIADKMVRATHKLFIEYTTDLLSENTNRIKIGTNIYDILLVADAGGDFHHYELLLKRLY